MRWQFDKFNHNILDIFFSRSIIAHVSGNKNFQWNEYKCQYLGQMKYQLKSISSLGHVFNQHNLFSINRKAIKINNLPKTFLNIRTQIKRERKVKNPIKNGLNPKAIYNFRFIHFCLGGYWTYWPHRSYNATEKCYALYYVFLTTH